jgi:hypothetical protein
MQYSPESSSQGWRTSLAVPGCGADFRYWADTEGVDGSGVAVAVAVVQILSAIARGPNEDRPLAVASLLHSVSESTASQHSWAWKCHWNFVGYKNWCEHLSIRAVHKTAKKFEFV